MTESLEFVQDGVDVFHLGAGLSNGWVLHGDHLDPRAHVNAQLLGGRFLDGLLLGFLYYRGEFEKSVPQAWNFVVIVVTIMLGRVA